MAMSMDDAVQVAWERFEAKLTMQVRGLDSGGGVVRIRSGSAGVEFGIVIRRCGDELRAGLLIKSRISANRIASLELFDWASAASGGGAWKTKVAGGEAATLAGQVGGTLRSVLGVISPEFVVIRTDRAVLREAGRGDVRRHFTRKAKDRADLMAMIARSVAAYSGVESVEVDSDGDFPVAKDGSTYVWARADEHLPVVRVWAVMAVGVRKKSQALTEVNLLNQRVPGVTFTLIENRVHVTADLIATPFSSEVLHNCLARVAAVIGEQADDFTTRCGGVPCPI